MMSYRKNVMSPRRPLQVASACHLCMVVLTIVIVFAVDNGSAKRGCAMFGHSCYGGHGKRSFQAPIQQQQQQQQQQPVRDWPVTSDEDTQQIDDVINKYYQIKSSSPTLHLTPFWQKWVQMYNDRKMDHPNNNNIM